MSVIDPQIEQRMKELIQKITYYNELYYQKVSLKYLIKNLTNY